MSQHPKLGERREKGGKPDHEYRFAGPLLAVWAVVALLALSLGAPVIFRFSFLILAITMIYLVVATILIVVDANTPKKDNEQKHQS